MLNGCHAISPTDHGLVEPIDTTSEIGMAHPRTLVGIGLALFGPIVPPLISFLTSLEITSVGVAVYLWILTGVLCAIIIGIEDRSLASVGLRRPDRWDVVLAISLWIVLMFTTGGWIFLLDELGLIEGAGGGGSDDLALHLVLFSAATVAIVEEFLYRGYGLERLEAVTDSTWIAGLATATVFVLIHLTTSVAQMLIVIPAAILLTLVYIWRRNLLVVIFAHVAVNVQPMLVG